MRLRIVTILLCLSFFSGIDYGAEYYVSTNGSDSTGNGSINAPFATVQFAIDTVGSRNTITLRGGNYTSNEIRIRVPHITIRSYPGEWAVITAPINIEEISMCIWIDLDASYTKLQNLEIIGGYYYAIKMESNWDWEEPTRYGASNILIEGCKIHDSGADCIKITPGSDYVTIRKCLIYNSGQRNDSNAEGIDNVNGDYMLVQDCHIHDTATTGIYAKGGAIGTIIERCLVRNCGELGISVGFDTSPEWFDTTVNPGYFENIDGIVRNCVIMNTVYAGIGIYGAKNPKIMNNTIINAAKQGQAAILFGLPFHDWEPEIPCPGAENVIIKNNIIVHQSAGDTPLLEIRYTTEHIGISGLTGIPNMSNNRYYIQSGGIGGTSFVDDRPASTFSGNLSQWQSHIAGDAASSQGNPGLDSNYHLVSGSACIDAGTTLADVVDDYDGAGRMGNMDIGADEYNTGVALQIPPPSGTIGTGNTGGGSPSETIILNLSQMVFTATAAGANSGTQTFQISNSGSGTLNWNVSDNVVWLACTPGSGSGSSTITVSIVSAGLAVGNYSGTISVSSANAANSPQTISVTLKVVENSALPFGSFDSPLDNTNDISGSIAVTGWALDDIEVKGVKIYLSQGNSLVFIGDAVFVEGARPDVQLAYPNYPNNDKAGWGYMMLTNFLPDSGNGTYTIHAIATDIEGGSFTLGIKTITCDNAHAVKPFGAIDMPLQGGVASGSSFLNWGWVLTPQPNIIPIDGSTLDVFVNGVNLGHPTYNIYRADIASLFPGYANRNGAVGYIYLNTMEYQNGVHTIQWTATDNVGNTNGIGSRYFTIQNTGRGGVKSQRFDNVAQLLNYPLAGNNVIYFARGLGETDIQGKAKMVGSGTFNLVIKELERIQIMLSASESFINGYIVIGRRLRPLPIGSTLDKKKGIFYWLPGPGFLGEYRFVFIQKVKGGHITRRNVIIKIEPKF